VIYLRISKFKPERISPPFQPSTGARPEPVPPEAPLKRSPPPS